MSKTEESEKTGTEKDQRERDLFEEYVMAKHEEEWMRAKTTEAYKRMMVAQNALIAYLDDMGKKSTGVYKDLGTFLVTEPIPTFRVPDEMKHTIYDWVRKIGAEAVIKETIHHATLQSLFRERFDNNQPLPEFIEVKFISQAKYLAPKG